MNVTRIEEAKPYQAPGHFDMRGLRTVSYTHLTLPTIYSV